MEMSLKLEAATGQAPAIEADTQHATPAAVNHGRLMDALKGEQTVGASTLWSGSAGDTPEGDPAAGQVVRGLAAMVNQRGGVMKMRLDPPELGELRIQMTIARGIVSADFQASSPQAHALLEKSIAALRSALEGQGLAVDRLTVHMSSTGSTGHSSSAGQDDSGQQQPGQQQGARSHADAGQGESRGRQEGDGSPGRQPHSGTRHHHRRFDLASFLQPDTGILTAGE
jgi:flagellar hook-length control protein FliK